MQKFTYYFLADFFVKKMNECKNSRSVTKKDCKLSRFIFLQTTNILKEIVYDFQ